MSPRETETPLSLLYSDLESEFAITRRVLERVPDGKDDWRPHEKSMTIGGLATHIAQLPWFGVMIATRDEMDITKDRPPSQSINNNAERLKLFDEASSNLRATLEKLTWEDVGRTWRFRMGDKVIVEAPRGGLIRAMVLTHTTHHRAQLGVFLRLLGIPVPSTYGPSADEPFGAN
jgi:uncharacterized damage-inducible protein DinB